MTRVCDCISHLTWINTRFHGDGFGSSCTNQSFELTEDFLYITTSAVALIIVLIFWYLGCRGLYNYKEMMYPLKMLFYLASTSSVCFTILCIITICLCMMSHKKAALIVGSISTLLYAFLFLCIWANLILRLFVSFRRSAFKMTTGEQRGYIAVFIYLLLNAFATSVCQLLMLVGMGLTPSIWFQFALGIAFMVVFAVSALVALCTFTSNVFALSKLRTEKQIEPFREEEPIGLNRMQQNLLDLSARYVLLFVVASLSSAVTMFSGFYESYAFAEDQYQKYCGKLDCSCKRMMTAGWIQSIHRMRREEWHLELQRKKVPQESRQSMEIKANESHKSCTAVTTATPTTRSPTTMSPTTMSPTKVSPTTVSPTSVSPTLSA